ncbi:hypothetical protein BH10BAC6_BH10BAC6_17440 [soil metagenome]
MRIVLLCVFMVITFAGMHAQQRVLIDDDFSSNSGEWFVGSTDDDEAETEIDDGVYRIEHKSESGYRLFFKSIPVDNKKNWSITTTIKETSGDTEHGYGIVFWAQDANNMYEFLVSNDGYARIGHYKAGDYLDVRKWVKFDGVHQGSETNVLELRKVNDALAFIVNGKEFAEISASFYTVHGSRVGFALHKRRTIEVDKFTITESNAESVNLVKDYNPDVKRVNLGPAVNEASDELVDAISPDGSMLFFSRSDHADNIDTAGTRDCWVSTRKADGSWGKAMNLGRPINNRGNNFVISVTPDLNTLILQNRYDSEGQPDGQGMSYSTRTRSGWSNPTNIEFDEFSNDAEVISSYLAPDGMTLLMSIQRTDSRGYLDLYVSFKKPDGTYTAPKNMGSQLNTIGKEIGPFIAADNKTLYFSSDGHPGYEGTDVFVSTRLDDTWTNWSQPLNLGKGINTDEHDDFFQVPAKGDSAYISSRKNSVGASDIFSVALSKQARPQPVIMMRGRVLNAETKEPVEALVKYELLPSGKQAGVARSAPSDGRYKVSLPPGEQYGVRAEAKGFYALSETFDTKALGEYAEVERDLFLTPIKENMTVRLNNVFFDFGKYDLRPESYPELDRLVQFLSDESTVMIEVAGHTDNVGDDRSNLTLSQNRVNSVRAYLESKGVATGRATAKGYGKTKPVAPNDTEQGRQQNRRVEFVILKK